MNKHNLDVYTDDFINKKEASFMEKLSEFFCFNLYMNMNELSYDEHLIFIEKFLLNLKGESSNENQC